MNYSVNLITEENVKLGEDFIGFTKCSVEGETIGTQKS